MQQHATTFSGAERVACGKLSCCKGLRKFFPPEAPPDVTQQVRASVRLPAETTPNASMHVDATHFSVPGVVAGWNVFACMEMRQFLSRETPAQATQHATKTGRTAPATTAVRRAESRSAGQVACGRSWPAGAIFEESAAEELRRFGQRVPTTDCAIGGLSHAICRQAKFGKRDSPESVPGKAKGGAREWSLDLGRTRIEWRPVGRRDSRGDYWADADCMAAAESRPNCF